MGSSALENQEVLSRSTLGAMVLKLNPPALGRLQEIVRERNGRYSDFIECVQAISKSAGKQPPEEREIDAIMCELEDGES